MKFQATDRFILLSKKFSNRKQIPKNNKTKKINQKGSIIKMFINAEK